MHHDAQGDDYDGQLMANAVLMRRQMSHDCWISRSAVSLANTLYTFVTEWIWVDT
jgi:hypothetical protein